jgi:hypothetical protein
VMATGCIGPSLQRTTSWSGLIRSEDTHGAELKIGEAGRLSG